MTAGSISNCVEVDRGNAVLLAEQRRDLLVLDEPELDQIEAELAPVGLLIGQRLLQLLRGDALLFEKQFADADGHVRRASVSDSVQKHHVGGEPAAGCAIRAPTAWPSTQRPRLNITLAPPATAGLASSTVLTWRPPRSPTRRLWISARRQRELPPIANRRPFAQSGSGASHATGPHLPFCPVRIADDSDTDTDCSVHPPHQAVVGPYLAPPDCALSRRRALRDRRTERAQIHVAVRRLRPLASPTASRAASGSVADAGTGRDTAPHEPDRAANDEASPIDWTRLTPTLLAQERPRERGGPGSCRPGAACAVVGSRPDCRGGSSSRRRAGRRTRGRNCHCARLHSSRNRVGCGSMNPSD